MAISTYKVYLMKKGTTSGATYDKLIDIKDFPDLGGEPEMLDTTTLSDGARTYIPGIQSQEALTFTANYTATDFQTLKALEDTEYDFGVYFGASGSGNAPTYGTEGKFTFKGKLTVFVTGGGVNEVVDMTISIAPSTEISFSAS